MQLRDEFLRFKADVVVLFLRKKFPGGHVSKIDILEGIRSGKSMETVYSEIALSIHNTEDALPKKPIWRRILNRIFRFPIGFRRAPR